MFTKGERMVFTENEKNVLKFISASGGNLSINELGNKLNISAGSAFRVLAKFEREGIITPHTISNITTHLFNFDNEKTKPTIELIYAPTTLEGRIKMRERDLEPLKKVTEMCLLFGSYITSKPNPSDIDVLFVLSREKFTDYKKTLEKVQLITPIKIQDVIQTKEDLIQNIKKKDKIIADALKKGIALWGFELLAEVIKDARK